ncbi:MAG: ABC-2 transporter permease [Solobacterium sp.]|nr:ABC-2 transporter permease [Solobacterium sp.]
MKAQLKKNLLIFFKGWSWIVMIITVILYFRFADMRPMPVLVYMGVYNVFLFTAVEHRDIDHKSGYGIHESFSPLTAEEKVYPEYITVFVFMALYTVISMLAGIWLYRLYRLFPLLPLLPAALILPWKYVSDNDRLQIFVSVCGALLTFFMFSMLGDVPLIVPHYPLWLLLCANLGCLVLFVLSAVLSVFLAKKRGGKI